jgi:hypothetical protein
MRRADEQVLRQPFDRRTGVSGTTIQPMRQPVIEKYFENELMTRPRRSPPAPDRPAP